MLESSPESTQGWKPWIVCSTAALFFLYEFIQMNMFGSLNQDLMRFFNVDATRLGMLATSYFVGTIIFLLPAGRLLDRYSPRMLILINMTCCVIGTVLFALSTHFYLAVLCRFFTGVGSAFCFLSSIRIASRWFAPKQMAMATGLIVTIGMIGGIIAQTPFAKLIEMVGWQNALFINAVLGGFIMTLISLIVQDYPSREDASANIHAAHPPFMQALHKTYLNKQNWLCGLYTCLLNLPIFVLGALWGSLYLQQVHNLSRTESSNAMSMIYIGTMIGSPVVGWISDRIGLRKPPMLLGAVISCMLMLLIMLVPHWTPGQFSVLFLLLGFITSSQVISYSVVNESNALNLTATATSVISICCIGSSVVFQPLFGGLMDLFWNHTMQNDIPFYSVRDYMIAMSVLPIAFVVAFFCAIKIKETHCQRARVDKSL